MVVPNLPDDVQRWTAEHTEGDPGPFFGGPHRRNVLYLLK